MAYFGYSSEEESSIRRNPFPRKHGNRTDEEMNTGGNSKRTASSFFPTMPTLQVDANLTAPSSSHSADLDVLSKQIMMAGMAALGMSNPAFQRQLGIGESSGQALNPIANLQIPSTLGNVIPDGSGLMKYRAPEVESFVFDRNTGYRYDPSTGLHYDANTGFFINIRLKIFMRWDPILSTYVRENKRSGPPPSLNSFPVGSLASTSTHQPVPPIQPIADGTPVDAIQRLAASSNSMLGTQPLLNMMGNSIPESILDLLTPAVTGVPEGLLENPLLRELWQKMVSLNKRDEKSNSRQDAESVDEPSTSKKKRKRKNMSSSDSSSSSSDSGSSRNSSRSRSRGSRKGKAKKRSRSRSRDRKNRKSRSRSRDKKKRSSRSSSREARKNKRSRSRSQSRRRRRSRSDSRRSRSPQRGRLVRQRMSSNRGFGRNRFQSSPKYSFTTKKPENPNKIIKCFNCGEFGHHINKCKRWIRRGVRKFRLENTNKDNFCYGCLKVADHLRADCPEVKAYTQGTDGPNDPHSSAGTASGQLGADVKKTNLVSYSSDSDDDNSKSDSRQRPSSSKRNQH